MKTIIKTGLVVAALAMLSGCIYDPGYVRSDGYYGGGDAYYGTSYYDDGYYPGYYYDPYYYWGPSIGLGFYYSDRGYRHHGWDGHHGNWGHGGNWGRGSNGWSHSGHSAPSRRP